MWHTTELVKIFEKMTDAYGYDIYQNRKLCVALCNDLFVDYSVEKNIMQMLFQAGLGEAMKGVPFKNERELKMGLSNIDKFLVAQGIEISVRENILEVMRLAFMDKEVNSNVKSAYQPVISKNFNDSHFKMTLPVIKEFTDRVDASFKFIYVNKGEEVDTVLEKCIITDKFGKIHSSRMDYELLTHNKSKNVTISIPVEDKKIYFAGANIEFIFLCSNHKMITTSYKINNSKISMLNQVAICQMTEAEYNRTIDIVGLLLKTMDSVVKPVIKTIAESSTYSATNEQPAYTSSDIKEYSDALRREIHYLKLGKGKRYKIVNGVKLNRSDKGIYTYSFEMETELHLPDDAPIVVETSGGLRAVGTVLLCEDFQMTLLLDSDLNDKVSSAHLMVEPWKLLEALNKRMTSLNPNVNKLAIKIMEQGPALSTDTDIAGVPKGQDAVERKLETDDIVTVWGPPGTGKTYTMAKIAKKYIAKNKSVLIVSHSNVSVDGVIKKVVGMLNTDMQSYLEDGKILRFGYVRDDELSQNSYATSFNYTLSKSDSYARQLEHLNAKRDELRAQNSTKSREYNNIELKIKDLRSEIRKEERKYVQRAQVIGTTISRATVDPMFEKRQFDLVMFDEVSMAYVPQVISAAALAREKFMCVGDFRQLAPISQCPDAHVLQVDIFSYLQIVDGKGNMYWHPWLVMLNEQRRMAPAISEFPNKFIYNKLLKNHPSVLHKEDAVIKSEPLPGDAMNLVNLAGTYCAADKNTDGSRFNILSAIISFSTAVKAEQNNIEAVGIITPYAAQTRLIRAMIKDYYTKGTTIVSCATVHQFQGSESDVIVFDAVESYPKSAVGYLMGKNPNQVVRLINVAITRGKGKVITVANERFWGNVFKGTNHVFYKLLQHIKNGKHHVIENYDKTLQPYIESITPDRMINIFMNEQDAISMFEQDMRKAKWQVVISLPSGELRETENQIFEMLDDADSRGIDILMKSNEYANLPKQWKEYCWGTENATFPLIIIDDELAWYGLPTAKWKFQVDKTTSMMTVVHTMVRIKGKNTIEMIKALTELETIVVGQNTKKLVKKKGILVTKPMVASSGGSVDSGSMANYGLGKFVEEKEFCPACKSHMVLAKNVRGTAYLKCSNKACKETKYLTVDLMNWYINSHNVKCPKKDGGELKGGLGKYGPYIRCNCGHFLKPDEI
ncbi:hypothetical protein BHF70_02095 [Anaerostipes sp. 494a]|uniref:AAA domain-containing protein n=1 Tax=Anaerostipes sp. 494a TaxID=1261636 RepID=UPI0009529F1B|nr:AAA domain-containing protein [Anaerostipes sp. 494a]OLR58514.1 hypothetical protein BHF70_02095 [Anaerostipes sp. 494a]